MMLRSTFLFLLSLSPCLAQMPMEIVNAELGKILQGVKSLPKSGAPGPVGIWGTMAFPIIAAPDREGVEIALAAAAGANEATLSWQAVAGAATYKVKRATSASGLPGR